MEASAGSGKTRLLVDRVVALLQSGAEPGSICVLTFTNVAAQEVSDRVLQKVAYLAQGDTQMQSVYDACQRSPVQVMTLHSFSYGLLREFSRESGLGHEVLLCDDVEQQQIWDAARLEGQADLDPWVKKNLQAQFGDYSLTVLLQDIKSVVGIYNVDIQPVQPVGPTILRLRAQNIKMWTALAQWPADLQTARARLLQTCAQKVISGSYENRDLVGAFCTQNGDMRAQICTKELSSIQEALEAEAQHVVDTLQAYKQSEGLRCSYALSLCLERVLLTYEQIKRRRMRVDYEDVIAYTKKLLQQPCMTEHVCAQYNHILVDEAQDTSVMQWDVILLLLEHMGNHWEGKSVFVVGDTKQSIYSFQGVQMSALHRVKQTLFERIPMISEIELNQCYRSVPAVLDTVNKVSDVGGHSWTKHLAFRTDEGCVEILPILEEESVEDRADRVAQHIAALCQKAPYLPCVQRPLQPQDILVLTQQRDAVYQQVSERLARYSIACAGVDKMVLSDSHTVDALICVAEAALYPRDSLRLATALRTPVFAWNTGDIPVNTPSSLWDYLVGSRTAQHQEVVAFFEAARIWADVGASAFFKWLVESRRAHIERYCDMSVLASFFEQCHNHEVQKNHSLLDFLRRLKKDRPVLKGVSTTRGVRMMTVHGSKGLEAPVVVLLDAHRRNRESKVRWYINEDGQVMVSARHTFWKPERFVFQQGCDEHVRLLYVALTRAQDHLIVMGHASPQEGSWWSELGVVLPQGEWKTCMPSQVKGAGNVDQKRMVMPHVVKAEAAIKTPTNTHAQRLAYMCIKGCKWQYKVGVIQSCSQSICRR